MCERGEVWASGPLARSPSRCTHLALSMKRNGVLSMPTNTASGLCGGLLSYLPSLLTVGLQGWGLLHEFGLRPCLARAFLDAMDCVD